MNLKSCFFLFLLIYGLNCLGQTKEQLTKGFNFMETQTYSLEENAELIMLFEGLRVADVSDGVDFVGFPNSGLVNLKIHPAWIHQTETMSHVMVGIVVTCRFVPTQRPNRSEPSEVFEEWHGSSTKAYSPGNFYNALFAGSVLVSDDLRGNEASGIGSANILGCDSKRIVGVVNNANARDIDEITLQKVPLYHYSKGRGARCVSSKLESVNRPVEIDGVTKFPGDGVIIVLRKSAKQVSEYAQNILIKHKATRRSLYIKLGIPIDKTL